jgi:uncharacterized protein YjiS (DUF1127 family)
MSEANAIIARDRRYWLHFRTMLRSIMLCWQTQKRVLRDMTYLRRQPDRMLQDIGLNRADLPDDHEFNSNSHQRL